MNVKKKIAALALAATLTAGGAGAAYAASFGNSLNVKYDGAAWNYSGSGYRNAWFKYSRAGKTLMHKVATNGKVTGSVWDNLLDWSSSQTTIFNWGHDR